MEIESIFSQPVARFVLRVCISVAGYFAQLFWKRPVVRKVDCRSTAALRDGQAKVVFENPRDAREVVRQFDGGKLNQRTIKVTFAAVLELRAGPRGRPTRDRSRRICQR